MRKSFLPFMALSALIATQAAPARADDAMSANSQSTAQTQPTAGTLPMPSIPYFDAVRWLNTEGVLKSLKIDTLLLPRQQPLGSFTVKPSEPVNERQSG